MARELLNPGKKAHWSPPPVRAPRRLSEHCQNCGSVKKERLQSRNFTCLLRLTLIFIFNIKLRFPFLIFHIFIQLLEVWGKGTPVFLCHKQNTLLNRVRTQGSASSTLLTGTKDRSTCETQDSELRRTNLAGKKNEVSIGFTVLRYLDLKLSSS